MMRQERTALVEKQKRKRKEKKERLHDIWVNEYKLTRTDLRKQGGNDDPIYKRDCELMRWQNGLSAEELIIALLWSACPSDI
jgi:hypothetical protein